MDDAIAPNEGPDRIGFYLLRGITRFCDGIGVTLVAAILFLFVSAFFARYLLGLCLPFTEVLASMFSFFSLFFGSFSAWSLCEHLSIDFFLHSLF